MHVVFHNTHAFESNLISCCNRWFRSKLYFWRSHNGREYVASDELYRHDQFPDNRKRHEDRMDWGWKVQQHRPQKRLPAKMFDCKCDYFPASFLYITNINISDLWCTILYVCSSNLITLSMKKDLSCSRLSIAIRSIARWCARSPDFRQLSSTEIVLDYSTHKSNCTHRL